MIDRGKGKRGMEMKPYEQLSPTGKHYRDLPEAKKNLKRIMDAEKKRKFRADNPKKYKEANKRTYRKYHERRLKEVREYRKKFPEKVRATNRRSYLTHHDERLKYMKTIRENLTEEQKKELYQQQLDWRKINPLRTKEYYFNKRFRVLMHYTSGTLTCTICGTFGYPFLAIDHIKGRKFHGHEDVGADKLHRYIIKNNFPFEFQILCHNCNTIKEIKRPKFRSQTKLAIRKRKHKTKLKFEVLSNYSGGTPKCQCCGYSTLMGYQ